MAKLRVVGHDSVELAALGAIVRYAVAIGEVVLEEEEEVAVHVGAVPGLGF
jgi:hypothetical protein